MRDVNNGWLVRYLHSNTASAFFFLVYLHIGRGIYYGSYRSPRTLVWAIGTVILIVMMATAFLGYFSSPKWFKISIYISSVYFIFIIYYIFNNIYIIGCNGIIILLWLILCRGQFLTSFYTVYYAKKTLNKTQHANKFQVESSLFNNRPRYVINKRFYSTANNNSSTNINNSNTKINISDRLDSIIKELGLNPVYVFDNLGDGFVSEITRQEVIKHTRGLSGVYMILNKVTKDYYIGSASTNKFYSRFCRHLIYFLGSKVVKSAVKKYGIKNFAFIVLDLFPEIVTQENNKDLLDLEDKYLKLFLPNYNILTEAGSSFGYKHSEIDRQKMKDIYSDVRRKMAGGLNRGKKFSRETIERMREAALKRPPMSPETRNKCITNTRPVILYNLNDTVFGKYSSIIEAAKAINCGEKTIRRALKTEKKLVKKQWIVKDFSNSDDK